MTCQMLSVGVPAYNQGVYLAETLESLLNQSVVPREIVVSDNHSTDNTAEVLGRFASQVKIVRPPVHLSATEHFNFLVGQLEGDWFALLSSDDVAMPDYVATLVRGACRASNSVLVRADHLEVDVGGNVVGERSFFGLRDITRPPRTFLEQLKGPRVSFAAFAVRRRAFDEVGGFDHFDYFGDWALWLKLSPLGPFVYCNEFISKYRVNYRNELARKRFVTEVVEEVEVVTRLIPRLMKEHSIGAHRKQRRDAKHRFRFRLMQGNKILHPVDGEMRQESARLMRPWAKELRSERLLEDFLAGKSIRQKWRLPSLRRSLNSIGRRALADPSPCDR